MDYTEINSKIENFARRLVKLKSAQAMLKVDKHKKFSNGNSFKFNDYPMQPKSTFELLCVYVILFLSIALSLNAFEIALDGTCKIEDKSYPAVGYGTYPLKGDACTKAVLDAAKIGYRIIDTATYYKNLPAIGKAMQILGRENFYIISKVWPNSQTAKLIQQDLETTLETLQTSYLDAYLIHFPNHNVPIEETLYTMEAMRKKGLIKHIGVSNFTINHLKRALELGVTISWLQVEMHPYFYDPELLEFCKEKSIAIQAWAPFNRGVLCKDGFLAEIGKKYHKTPAQVALKWIIQQGCLPLPGTHDPKHMGENFHINDFTLSKEDMEKINQNARIGKRERIRDKSYFGFTDEFDFTYEQCWPSSMKNI
jgi:diketogulonate reductase-like aldo/keto reductase